VLKPHLALVGDYSPDVVAHRSIPLALTLACSAGEPAPGWTWIDTATLSGDVAAQLQAFDGIWCVPGSPYVNTDGAIAAIRFAREEGRPFLGTCGGFQHALLEYASAVWGMPSPGHAEVDPDAADPLISPLSCSFVEKSGTIGFEPGSRLSAVYGAAEAVESYHCRYGLNPNYADRLASGPLRVAARDLEGDVRAFELDEHPFFVATLYQPERSGLAGLRHRLIVAFVDAARRHAATRLR
jgi:CTP synthase (UTP-ammonia lyase)